MPPPAPVSFNEEPAYRQVPAAAQVSGFAKLVIGWGLAKDEQGATYVLAGVIGFCVIAAVVVLFVVNGSAPHAQTPLDPNWPRPTR